MTTPMTKEQFKARWDSDELGGGITFDDCADCYVTWGLGRYPKTKPLQVVRYAVLVAANVEGAEDFKPEELLESPPR